MPDVKFNRFTKGWYFRQQHLVGLDGFTDVNNFVIYKNGIEKVHGWRKLHLQPTAPVAPNTTIHYPLDPEVLSIFEYLKFQEEEIHLGELVFNPITFFNVPRELHYFSDFTGIPRTQDTEVCSSTAYGMLWTCDILNCMHPFAEVTYDDNPCNILSGPAIGIQAPFNHNNATLYGLIYDPINTELVLAGWNHQSLSDYGTVLGVYSVTLSPGDIYKILVNDDGTISGLLNNTEVLGPVNDIFNILNNSCTGIIWVPSSSDSSSGGEPPEDCNDNITHDSRSPTNGCLDSIVDDYYDGSYTPTIGLNGSRASGCVNGDITRFLSTGVELTVRSGITLPAPGLSYCPMAGFSIWFGNVTDESPGAAGNPVECEAAILIDGPPVGNPIFGLAFNVLLGSTVENFTGLAILVNYNTNKTQLVQYTNQNLRVDSPTILLESAIMPDYTNGAVDMILENYPSVNDFRFTYYDGSNHEVFNTGVGYVSPNTEMGIGFIWVGNPIPGVLHSITLKKDNFGENFQFVPSV